MEQPGVGLPAEMEPSGLWPPSGMASSGRELLGWSCGGRRFGGWGRHTGDFGDGAFWDGALGEGVFVDLPAEDEPARIRSSNSSPACVRGAISCSMVALARLPPTWPLTTIVRPSMMMAPRSVICPKTGRTRRRCRPRRQAPPSDLPPTHQRRSLAWLHRVRGPVEGLRPCWSHWEASHGGSTFHTPHAHESWQGWGARCW